jgi:hypothetical protein
MSLETRLQKLEAAIGPQEPVTIRVYHLPPEAMDLQGEELAEWCRAHPGEYKTRAVRIEAQL